MISCLVPDGNPHSGQGRTGWWWLKRGTTSDVRTRLVDDQRRRSGKKSSTPVTHPRIRGKDQGKTKPGTPKNGGSVNGGSVVVPADISVREGMNRLSEGTNWPRSTTFRAGAPTNCATASEAAVDKVPDTGCGGRHSSATKSLSEWRRSRNIAKARTAISTAEWWN